MIAGTLFVGSAVLARQVKLPNGTVHELHFKELTQRQWRQYYEARNSDDAEARERATAEMIAQSLCEPDGAPALTVEQALTLKPAALLAISNKILEVNDFTEAQGND
jgi:hypothetical protein